jgi:hypothetical protein
VKGILIVISCLFFAAAIPAQTAEPPENGVAPASGIEEAYLAKDDGDGKAGDPATSFFTTDIPIYCVVMLTTSGSTTVKMNFVAVNVTGVKPETKVVTTVYKTKARENRVNFTGRPYDNWSAGKYRVEIFLDEKKVKEMAFDIKPASGSIDGAAAFQHKPKPKTVRPKHIDQ